MTNIVDRRKNGKNKSAANRKRFLDRYKKHIKKAVDEVGVKGKIKDILKDRRIKIPDETIDEPTFDYDRKKGTHQDVYPGNEQWRKGDTVKKEEGSTDATAGNSGEGEDEFAFVLSKKEFIEIYFSDVALPNFIKKTLNKIIKFVHKKKGYTKDGIPARLNIKKTFENSIARKIANKRKKKKSLFLDDTDVRYDLYLKDPKPIHHAVMFAVMDVSGSMDEWHKMIAKKFFTLLFLFLHKEYDSVEIIFIRHHHRAEEATEEEFFFSRETGGTVVSTAYDLVLKIINERYNASTTNFYLAQASDGDNFFHDRDRANKMLDENIIPLMQYTAYIQIQRSEAVGEYSIYTDYKKIADLHENFNVALLNKANDVYKVFKSLFKKDEE